MSSELKQLVSNNDTLKTVDPMNVCNNENAVLKRHIVLCNMKYMDLKKQNSDMKRSFSIQTLLFILLVLILFVLFGKKIEL